MRRISFTLTTQQIRNRTKTVTRRLGWTTLQPGTLLQPVVKAQGLKKGERVETIGGPIRVLNVRREPLYMVKTRYELDVVLEGFPLLTKEEFIELFCRANKCKRNTVVTRISFEYIETRTEG